MTITGELLAYESRAGQVDAMFQSVEQISPTALVIGAMMDGAGGEGFGEEPAKTHSHT